MKYLDYCNPKKRREKKTWQCDNRLMCGQIASDGRVAIERSCKIKYPKNAACGKKARSKSGNYH